MSIKPRVQISTGTKGEFELTASVQLLDENGDYIDSIYGAYGDDAIQVCKKWAVQNGYEVYEPHFVEESIEVMCARAGIRIKEAEDELGLLTSGQRRDLLKDNFDWDSDTCDEVVRLLDELDAERWRIAAAHYFRGMTPSDLVESMRQYYYRG